MSNDTKTIAPCCISINQALGTFELRLAEIGAKGSLDIQNNFPASSPEAITRNALATAALNSVATQFRDALYDLTKTSKCNNPCCDSAAFAYRDLALGIAGFVSAAASNPNMPLVNPEFNLLIVLTGLVGSGFVAGTPTGVSGSLADSFESVIIKNCCKKSSCDRR